MNAILNTSRAVSLAALLILAPAAFAQAGPAAEIRAIEDQMRDALRKCDAERLSRMYTPDARLVMPGRLIEGRDAIRAHMLNVCRVIGNFRLEEQEFIEGPDTLVETGRTVFFNTAGVQLGADRYMTLWKKTDGQWRIHRDLAVPPPKDAGAPSASFAVKKVEPQTAIILPMTGSHDQHAQAIARLSGSLQEAGLTLGAPFGRYYNSPASVAEAELRWEVGFFVPRGTPALPPPFEIRELEPMTVVFAVVPGPHAASRPWPQLDEWVTRHGYVPVGPAMEIWQEGPKTEMRVPVNKP